jgi:hypothetical protein
MIIEKFLFTLAMCCLFSQAYAKGISNTGAWEGKDVDCEHVYDQQLSDAIVEFLKNENAITAADFGCGMGDYVKALNAAGIAADGFDGNPHTPELTGGVGEVLDLSIPTDLNIRYDWVVSLEVGEHIPFVYETNFIENLVRHARKGIILSWAVKGQPGYGHVNCRNNPYVKNKIESYGFVNDVKAENEMRKRAFYPWFKNTVMVFRTKTPNTR